MNDESLVIEQTVAEPVEVSKESVPTPDETVSQGEDVKQPEAKPEKTFTQKELDDILTRRLAKEQRKIERYVRADAENQYLREQLQAKQAPQTEQFSGEPKPEQFKTYEDYIDKLTDWKLDQREAKASEQSQAQRQAQYQAQQEAKIIENLSKAADKYEDFDDVVSNPNLPITPVMRDAIGESEIAGDVAYYLGTNPKEAAEIARMSNVQQVKAIDRIEAKLKAPAVKLTTDAPEPIEPNSNRGKVKKDTLTMTDAEYAKWRKTGKTN